jgi:competence protein ComEA
MVLAWTDKERMALIWALVFLALGGALKAHQMHAKSWGDAFMAPPPVAQAFRVGGAPTIDSAQKPMVSAVPVERSSQQPTNSIALEKPSQGEVGEGGTAKSVAAKKGEAGCAVAVNAATVGQLQGLPGVGAKTAASIVAHREKNGPFRKAGDLLAVKGIGQKKLDRMRACLIL